MDMVALGAKIRRLRKDMGISQEALAERVGVSPVYICMVENGKRTMSLALLDRIANELERVYATITDRKLSSRPSENGALKGLTWSLRRRAVGS